MKYFLQIASFTLLCLMVLADIGLKPTDILKLYNYSYEEHVIITEDGYILSILRLPPKTQTTKLPVLLVHALFSSAAGFLVRGPEKALAFRLHDNNYDVWMLNCRGTRSSLNHTKLESNSSEYWNFSWHEIGVFDIPATIDYILNVTKQKQILHVGHSQGCTSLYVLLSEKPVYNKYIKAHLAFAPTTYLCHMKSETGRNMALPEKTLTYTNLVNTTGNFNLTPRMPALERFFTSFCNSRTFAFCANIIEMGSSLSASQIDLDYIPTFFQHFPAGCSIKQVLHYAQGVHSCRFKKYQTSLNLIPESYNLQNIKIPIYGFYGDKDDTQDPLDTLRFRDELPNGFVKTFRIKNWNHLDFTQGKHANERVYINAIHILDSVGNI